MNKKNLSITISVFIAAFVVTILNYILINQNLERYRAYRINMPEDIAINKLVDINTANKIKGIENVEKVGLKEEYQSIKINDNILSYVGYNEEYFEMQYNFFKKGSYPKYDNEIILSEKTMEDLGLNLGDKIDIDFGNRVFKGEILNPLFNFRDNEKFDVDVNKEYKIVGVYKTKNPMGIQEAFGNIDFSGNYYPSIKVEKLSKSYETKKNLEDFFENEFNEKVLIIPNEGVLRFFHILETGTDALGFITGRILVPFVLFILFVVMIKNIFNVWAIYKIKELSIYKSIGATNYQIYKILLRDSLKISFLPLIIGEFAGFALIKGIFSRVFSLQEDLYGMESGGFDLNWILVIGIAIFLLAIIMIAVTFPTRAISKVEILEGLRENLSLQNFKKKPSDNLFRELRLNNRKILRPMFFIMVLGLAMVESMFGIVFIDKYNVENREFDRDFNFSVRYSTSNNEYPKIFEFIKEKHQPENSLLTVTKRFYVDMKNLKYSDEFNSIGYNKGFEDFYFYSETNLVDGILIGVEDDRFFELSNNKEEVILMNQVQKDPQEFYKNSVFIPYLDENTEEVKIKYLEDFDSQTIKIDKSVNKLLRDQDRLELYNVELVTSLDKFQKIMKEGEREFLKRNMEFPTIYYNLEMKFDEKNINGISQDIKKIMEENVNADEKYSINNIVMDREAKKISKQGLNFLLLLVLISVIFLNIANSYSAINLYFFNRKREVGALLSNGMYVGDLENLLKKEITENIVISFIVSTIISILLIGYLISTIAYIKVFKYLSLVRFEILIPIVVLICISTYVIYISAMKKVTKMKVVELLKGF